MGDIFIKYIFNRRYFELEVFQIGNIFN